MKVLLRILITLLLPVLIGCGAGMYHQGKSALDRQDYSIAVTAFKNALERQPDKALIWQQLGIAYYRTNQFLNAANAFKQAALLDSEDDVSILYLGLSYEVLGKEDEALQVYRSYLSTMPESELTNRIRRRVRYLSDSILRDEVRSVIAREDSIDADKIPGNTVSVLGFKTEKIDPQYAALGRGLAQMLMADFAKVSALRVIERMKLNEIARELELSSSELADKQHAPRLGKLLGAATLVTGDLLQPEPERLSVEAGVIRTAEGLATYPDGASGELDQFFLIEKELLYNILNELGHTPTEAERVRLDSIPTSSFLSFLAYSRGLTYLDAGMYRLAEAEFSAALTEDPNFSAAAKARDQVAGLDGYTGEVEPGSRLEMDIYEMAHTEEVEPESGYGLVVTRSILGFQPDEALPSEGDNPIMFPRVKGKVTVSGTFDPD